METNNNENNIQENETLDMNHLMQVRREKLDKLREEGHDPFEITKFERTHTSKEIMEHYDELEGKDVTVAGRIMGKRIMGKASFCHIQDGDGKIQSYVSINELGEESYKQFKEDDIGDIIGITGFVFKTRTGEISIHAKKVTLLAKSLKPLPEKFHGLKDTDLRYRQRYIDLIMNPEVKDAFIKRTQIIKEMKRILDDKGYLEVETPILNTISGGATARPFITHHNTLDIDMYLRIATELNLKRLVVGGFEKVYEIGRIFRNEGMDIKHNPEFTTIELYSAYENLEDMMNLTEELVSKIAQKVLGTMKINYQGVDIDLTPEWKRITMIDAIKEVTGVDFNTIKTDEEAEILSSMQNAQKQLFESINNGITNILVGIKDWILKIPNLVMSIVFGFIALYFMCTDKIYMIDQLEHHLPDIWTKKISKHLHAIIQKLGHYLKAEATLIFISFIISLIGFTIFNMLGLNVGFPLLVSIGISFVDALPILGSGAAMAPWAVIEALNGNIKLGIAIIILWAIMGAVRNFLEPKLVSKHIGIHPVFTLISMFTGYKIIGVTGMILGPIFLIVLKEIYTPMIDKGVLRSIFDRDD